MTFRFQCIKFLECSVIWQKYCCPECECTNNLWHHTKENHQHASDSISLFNKNFDCKHWYSSYYYAFKHWYVLSVSGKNLPNLVYPILILHNRSHAGQLSDGRIRRRPWPLCYKLAKRKLFQLKCQCFYQIFDLNMNRCIFDAVIFEVILASWRRPIHMSKIRNLGLQRNLKYLPIHFY